MSQEDFKMSAFSGVKVRPSLRSINCLARWVWLTIAIFFLFWFTFSLHFVKNPCPVIIFSILFSSLFPYPFIPSLFLILFSVSSVSSLLILILFSVASVSSLLILILFSVASVSSLLILILFSVASVFSVAKISTMYINEMQPSVFLPVYFSYNHRTLYRTTSAETAHSFHLLYHLSKSIKALLCQPLCKTQTLSCKAKVMPIV